VLLEEGEPAAGRLHVGVPAVVAPGDVGGLGQADVGRFTEGVLAGIDASYLHVEGIAAIAGVDDHGASRELPEGFEDGAAELLQGRDALQGDGVVDAVDSGHGLVLEFFQREMLGKFHNRYFFITRYES